MATDCMTTHMEGGGGGGWREEGEEDGGGGGGGWRGRGRMEGGGGWRGRRNRSILGLRQKCVLEEGPLGLIRCRMMIVVCIEDC